MNSTEKKALGVGIIGAGRVSRDHAYAVQRHAGLQLVGVAEPDEEKRSRFVQRYRCDACANHRDLLAKDGVDMVLVGVPHWLHAPVVKDVLNAGVHCMVEKPMAMTVEECRGMVAAAEENGVRLMVGHTQHFFPANIAVKGLVARGEIGEIVIAAQAWYKPFGLAGRPPWMLDREKGGGMWLMNGAHMLDCLMWFVDSEVAAVKGSVTNKIVKQKADDSIVAFIEFTSGVCATLAHSGSKRPEPPPPEQWFTTEVTGTEGSARVISYEGKAWVNTQGEDKPVTQQRNAEQEQAVRAFLNAEAGRTADAPMAQSAIEQTSGIVDEVAAFAEAVALGYEPPVSNRHALAVMATILAVEESSRTGREVRLR